MPTLPARILKRVLPPPMVRYLRGVRAKAVERHAHDAELLFCAQFMAEGDLVFDVGANVGDKTAIFRTLGARVVAIEPQGRCVAELRERFGDDPAVTVVHAGAGAEAGEMDMLISEASDTSSLSREWVSRVQESGRLGERQWDGRERVTLRTLDSLIAEHGVPVFCKIDVEGFEDQVLQGLSTPVQGLSVEFTREFPDPTIAVLDRLAAIGDYELNLTRANQTEFRLPRWCDVAGMREALTGKGQHVVAKADIYARLK